MNKKIEIALLLLLAMIMIAGNAGANGISGKNRVWNTIGPLTDAPLSFESFDENLYVGGWMFDVNGGDSDGFGAWDGNKWLDWVSGLDMGQAVLKVFDGNLYVGGQTLDMNGIANCDYFCVWNGKNWFSIGPLNGEVLALEVFNNKLYVGGAFQDANGDADSNHITVWNGTTWETIGKLNNEVHALKVYDGNLYVGGDFTDANDLDSNRIVAWDGTNWNYVADLNSRVDAFEVYNNKLYVGGYFSNILGADNIAAWDETNWYSIGSLNNNVYALIAYNEKLYIGGRFTNADSISTADRIVAWNGSEMESIGALNNDVLALHVYNGNLYVGGNFTDANNIGDADFLATYFEGYLKVQFWDENSKTKIAPTTLSLNDVNILGYMGVDGNLSIHLSLLVNGYYTIKAQSANYSEREWTVLIDTANIYDYNFALLPTVLGRDVPFEFYKPDALTRVASTLVSVWNTDGNYISSIISTNALGQVSYFLNAQDENYRFVFSYGGTNYDYGETLVTVKIPKDEQTLALINPWNLTVDGITFWDFNGLTTDKDVYVFSDLYGYHYFDVNATNYFERSYALRFKGGVATYTLQPYLVSPTTGLNVAFFFVNDLTGAALGDVTMILKKNIPGEGFVQVESVESDDAGKVVISAVYNNRYTAFFYYDGTLIKTNDYLMNASTYTVALVLWGIEYKDPTRSGVYTKFISSPVITYTTDYNLQAKLYADFAGVNHINTFATYNGATIVSSSQDVNANQIGSTDLNAIIIVSGLDSTSSITIIWTIEATLSDGNTVVSTESYTFRITGSAAERSDFLHTMSVDVPKDLGCPVGSPCPVLIIISLFVALVVVAMLSTTIHVDFTSLSVIAVAVLGFFVMVNWVPFGLWIVLCLAAGVTTIASRRVLK